MQNSGCDEDWGAMEADEVRAALDDVTIRSLIARIAHLADTGEVEDYVDCFTVDARWDMPGGPKCGHDQIRRASHERRAAGATGPGSRTRHAVGTIVVVVDDDRACATSYFQFLGQTDTAPRLLSVGQYDDEFVRTPDGWRLDHRRITLG
jgi:3-phenylpropionate/cinnamic acid dioxygenase small subunit